MKTKRIVPLVLSAAALVATATSCGNVVRSSRSPVILVVNSLLATRGAPTAATPTSTLSSDVVTVVTSGGTCTTQNPCTTIFDDTGTLTLSLAPKDITNAAGLTSNNQVTITRIHVSYRRTDGRNTEGVDVPYSFDTAATVTVPTTGTATASFVLVRNQAKQEAPLVQLVTNGQLISAIADVTAFGTDIVGNAVSATGSIGVTFGNFGDF
jgi:hypothetical protein